MKVLVIVLENCTTFKNNRTYARALHKREGECHGVLKVDLRKS